MDVVCRNSFPKLSNFPWYFTQLGKFRGGTNFENHADPEKRINNNKNSQKSRENSWNLLKAFLRLRKEENLYCHCDMNNVWIILLKGSTLLRGCWFWSKNLDFPSVKNFDANFISAERVTSNLHDSRKYRWLQPLSSLWTRLGGGETLQVGSMTYEVSQDVFRGVGVFSGCFRGVFRTVWTEKEYRQPGVLRDISTRTSRQKELMWAEWARKTPTESQEITSVTNQTSRPYKTPSRHVPIRPPPSLLSCSA